MKTGFTATTMQWRRKEIVSVEAMSCHTNFFISFCGGSDFFQRRALAHSKNKVAFFPRVYNVTIFRAYRILPRCRSQAILRQGDCSAIKQ